MLNQKTVIYIILSAILLYLYYKRGGIAIFVAFAVVVAGTLFAANAREGMDGKKRENAKNNKTKDNREKDSDDDKDKDKAKDKDNDKDKANDNDNNNDNNNDKTKNKTKKNSEKNVK